MTGLHWTDIDGVATVWVDTPGPLKASLLFRAGYADETLITAGRTHLLEHLVFSALGEAAVGQNGEVGGVLTGFHAVGASEKVAAFLEGVCRHLGSPPERRLANEKKILEAESAARSRNLANDLLNWRYGAAGYGLAAMPQLGISSATLEDLHALAALRFTRGNAILCLSGPPPAGLHLALPEGAKQPLPPLIPVRSESPSWLVDDTIGGVALSSTGARSAAATIFVSLANKRLRDRLRTKRALSYSPTVSYEPLDTETAHLVFYADSEEERREDLVREFTEGFELLAHPPAADIEEARREVLDQMAGALTPPPDALAVISVNRAALDWIFGREFQTFESLAAETAAVTDAEVQVYGRGLRYEALFVLPGVAQLRESMGEVTSLFTGGPVGGRTVRHNDAPINKERLVVGQEGVSLRYGDGTHRTVRYAEVVAAVRSEDGAMTLVNTAAGGLTVESGLWRDGSAAVAEILSHVPAALIVDYGVREPEQIPVPATDRWDRIAYWLQTPWIALVALIVVGAVVNGTTGIPALALLFYAIGAVTFFSLRARRRAMPRPPAATRPAKPRRATRRDSSNKAGGKGGLAIDGEAVADRATLPVSFSFIVFRGSYGTQMEGLLHARGYERLREWGARGNPSGLRDAFATMAGRDQSVVLKAYWSSSDITVLVDPQMVASAALEEQLTAFCATHATEAAAASWEQASETVILIEIDGTGVKRRTWYQHGKPFDSQKDPRMEMKKEPDPRGLRAALAANGLPVEKIFADADVTVVELRSV